MGMGQQLDRTKQTEVPPSDGTKISRCSGRRSVYYRDVNGKMHNAVVVAPGSGSGLKLAIPGGGNLAVRRVLDNIAVGSNKNQTNVYFNYFQ